MLVLAAGLYGEEQHGECFGQMLDAWDRAVQRGMEEGWDCLHSVGHACFLWLSELRDACWLRADYISAIYRTSDKMSGGKGICLSSYCTTSCWRGVTALLKAAQSHTLHGSRYVLCDPKTFKLTVDTRHSTISTAAQIDLLDAALRCNVQLDCERLSFPDCLTRAQSDQLSAILPRLTHLKHLAITASSWTALNVALRAVSSTSQLHRLHVTCSPSSLRDSPPAAPAVEDPWSLPDELLDNISRFSALRGIALWDEESTVTEENRRAIKRRISNRLPGVEVEIWDTDPKTGPYLEWETDSDDSDTNLFGLPRTRIVTWVHDSLKSDVGGSIQLLDEEDHLELDYDRTATNVECYGKDNKLLNVEDSSIRHQTASSENSSETKESVGCADELKPKKASIDHSKLPYETSPCSKLSNVVVHSTLVGNRKLSMMLVGHDGGTLSFAEEDITLVVPFGAVKKGQQKQIVLGCSTDYADIPCLGKHQALASSIVHCLPHGTEFNELITVRIGLHHNGEVDDHPGKLKVLHSLTDLGQPTNWRELPTGSEQHGSNNIVLVTERDVYLMVKSFCAWCVVRNLPHGHQPPVPFYTRIMIFAKLSRQPALVTFNVVFADSSLEKDVQQDPVYGHKIGTHPLEVYCLDEPITVHIGRLCPQWKQHEFNLNSQLVSPHVLLDKQKTSVTLWLQASEDVSKSSLLSCYVEVEHGEARKSIPIVTPLSELTLNNECAGPTAETEAEQYGCAKKDMPSNAIPVYGIARDPSRQTPMSGGQNAACSSSSCASCSSYPDNQPQQLVSAIGETKTNETSMCPTVPGKDGYGNSCLRLKDCPKIQTTLGSVNVIPHGPLQVASGPSAGGPVLSSSIDMDIPNPMKQVSKVCLGTKPKIPPKPKGPTRIQSAPVDALTNRSNNNSSGEHSQRPSKCMMLGNCDESRVKDCNPLNSEMTLAAGTTRSNMPPVSHCFQQQGAHQLQPGCPTEATQPDSSEEGSVIQVTTGQYELDGRGILSAVPAQEQTALEVAPEIRRQSLEEVPMAQATTMQGVSGGHSVHPSVSVPEQTALRVSTEVRDDSLAVISTPDGLCNLLSRVMNDIVLQLGRNDHQARTFIQQNSLHVQSGPSGTMPYHCDILTQMQPESVVLSNMVCGIICHLLDPWRHDFKDWRGFADKLGVSGYTGSLEQRPSPTWVLLQMWRSRKKPLDDLTALLNKMGRPDVADAIAEAVQEEKDME